MSIKKRRKDSKLWTLDPKDQAHLYQLCSGVGGYEAARAWLKQERGIEVKSDATFTAWWSVYPFSLPAAADFATNFEQEMAKLPEMEGQAAQISRLGQVGFEVMAMRSQNLKGFAQLKKLRQKDAEIALSESKHSLALKQYEDRMASAKEKLEGLKSKGGLTAETLKTIEEAVGIL